MPVRALRTVNWGVSSMDLKAGKTSLARRWNEVINSGIKVSPSGIAEQNLGDPDLGVDGAGICGEARPGCTGGWRGGYL